MTTYRLARDPRPATGAAVPPVLDADQQEVVDHPGGPLLVLAGPGTGKTTTLVEAIARRIEDGADPASVLALTFSRKAAEQLRDRVTARLGRTTGAALCQTFHSFAYGLIRSYSPTGLYDAPLRLLSAPEADVVLRELLNDSPESVRWPESLQRALGTHGFVREVHAVLSRAREKQLDGAQLRALGERHDLPEFVAAGLFLDQYLTVLDSLGATDYADLIRRAVIEATAHRDELRRRYRHVYVDEYQDTDPGQVALLQELAGDGGDLVVVGDPHQSIYGFRGAEVRGIQEFPDAFPTVAGDRAPVVVLRRTRRFGPRLALAAARVSARIGTTGFDAATAAAFAHPVAEESTHGAGRVEVRTFDTDRAEAEHLADLLRRAHLEDGLDWSDMAVLVRSGQNHIPPLRRALAAAGVPVEVASDDLPLTRDPAVLPLIDALRAVLHLDDPDIDSVDYVDAGRAEGLLLSPLGGLDAGDVRVLLRLLRQREKSLAADEDRPPAPSRELLRRAVVERGFLDGVDGRESSAARALAELLRRGPTDWPRVRPPRRCCGTSGRGRPGRSGSVGRSTSAAPPPAGPIATSTRSAPSSRPPRGPRSAPTTWACGSSSTACRRSRSRPTPSPSGGSAAPRSGCSPRTGPRAWSGSSSSSPTSSRRPGRTCGVAPACSARTGSTATTAEASWSSR